MDEVLFLLPDIQSVLKIVMKFAIVGLKFTDNDTWASPLHRFPHRNQHPRAAIRNWRVLES